MAVDARIILVLLAISTVAQSNILPWTNIQKSDSNSVYKFSQQQEDERPADIPKSIWPSYDNAVQEPLEETNEVSPLSMQYPDSYGPFPEAAAPCTKDVCKPPSCRCSGTDIPGGLKVKDTPQMVLFSFQTAVQDSNYGRYTRMFQGRKNPNGCPRTGTFFVSHNYTDYWQVQSLYAARHEIGDNSVTSPPPPLTGTQWVAQVWAQKYILSKWASIQAADIRGFRAPYLTPGGDAMINAISAAGMKYDSSRTTISYMDPPNLLWPYTYDYASTQDCVVQVCPTESHRGIWEIPLLAWRDKNKRVYATPGGCAVDNEQEALALLKNKFLSHYNSNNRAPVIIPMDVSWVVVDYKLSATIKFLDWLNNYKDTYVVTHWQAIQWIMNPTPLSKITNFGPWKCDSKPPQVCSQDQSITCQFDKDRHLVPKGGTGTPVYRLHTCQKQCPQCYPFINDPLGQRC